MQFITEFKIWNYFSNYTCQALNFLLWWMHRRTHLAKILALFAIRFLPLYFQHYLDKQQIRNPIKILKKSSFLKSLNKYFITLWIKKHIYYSQAHWKIARLQSTAIFLNDPCRWSSLWEVIFFRMDFDIHRMHRKFLFLMVCRLHYRHYWKTKSADLLLLCQGRGR